MITSAMAIIKLANKRTTNVGLDETIMTFNSIS